MKQPRQTRAIHKSGLLAFVVPAGKGWLLVQFDYWRHPHSHGWHLYRRKDFRRWRSGKRHYNRIKDELGYTPRYVEHRNWFDMRAAKAKGIGVDLASGPDKTTRAVVDMEAAEPRVLMHVYSEAGEVSPETWRALETMGLATFEAKGKA